MASKSNTINKYATDLTPLVASIGPMRYGTPRHLKLETKEFLGMKPIPIQRQTAFRIASVAKFLSNNPMPTHEEVAIAEYPDSETGDTVREVINANTRGDIWAISMGMETMTGIDDHEVLQKKKTIELCNKVKVPSEVSATIYPCDSKKAAEELYRSFDSMDSVEKTAQKITGLCRSMGVDFRKLGLFKKGNIVKILQYAGQGYPDTNEGDSAATLGLFFRELQKIDEISTTQNKAVYNANIICSFVKMFKKYGCEDKKVKKMLQRLEDSDRGPSSKSRGRDGITFLLEEMDSRSQFPTGWKTDATSMPLMQDFILWCLENQYSGALRKQYKAPNSNGGKGNRKNLHNSFWEFLEDDDE